MISSVACPSDADVQKEVFKILKNNPDAILINCRIKSEDSGDKKQANLKAQDDFFGYQFCGEKIITYFSKLGLTSVQTPLVVVNGKYTANHSKVSLAVEMAQSIDKLEKLTLNLDKNILNIEIPDSELQAGEIFVYAYKPTQEITIGSEETKTKQDQEKLPKSEPFEGQRASYQQFYARPVVAFKKVADWGGKEKKISYNLSDLDSFGGQTEDLSYVVVLADAASAAVIAVGEWKSSAETKASQQDFFSKD